MHQTIAESRLVCPEELTAYNAVVCRLVEALEMYDNPHFDSYVSEEQDGSLGAGRGSIHPFGSMRLGDDMDGDDKALLGGGGMRKVGR